MSPPPTASSVHPSSDEEDEEEWDRESSSQEAKPSSTLEPSPVPDPVLALDRVLNESESSLLSSSSTPPTHPSLLSPPTTLLSPLPILWSRLGSTIAVGSGLEWMVEATNLVSLVVFEWLVAEDAVSVTAAVTVTVDVDAAAAVAAAAVLCGSTSKRGADGT